jgi:predicted Zn finger-like uncharacterized protein
MPITINCPNCATKYKVRDESLGANAQCKKCGNTFTVAISLDETPSRPLNTAELSKVKAPSSKNVSDSKTPTAAIGQPVGQTTRKTIGKYLVRRKLGAGGMGEVWLGHDSDLQRDVAIKILPALTQDQESLKRFMREARLAAKLHHTNTVAVYEVGVDGKVVFIAMELVDGQSLDKTVETGAALPWREATQAIRDAAAGLAAAHELGLIHRDIKPANLMRTTKGITKVVDFGLARAQAGESRLTQEKMVLGTPAYMSPEQWMGGEVDARTDLYSLTCTYYQLLTGKAPFDAPTFAALGYQHRHEPFPDPRKLKPDLPDAVCRILAHGSQKAPAERFQTALQLRGALDSLLSMPSESLTAEVPWLQLSQHATQPLGDQGKNWLSTAKASGPLRQIRKHPALAGAAAIVLLIVGLVLSISFSGSPQAEPTQVAATSTPPAPLEIKRKAPTEDNPAPAPIASRPAAPVSEQPVAATRSSSAGLFDDSNLELIEEVEPQFTPVAAADSAKIERMREQTLNELRSSNFELTQVVAAMLQPANSMAPGPSPGFNAPPTAASNELNLPQRFLLTGKLGAVRVQGRSTWVFLWVPTSGSEPPPAMGGSPFPPVAGIEFPNVDLTQSLADYRVGDEVCLVVKRSGSSASGPPAGFSSQMMPGMSVPPVLMKHIQEFRQFADGAIYWTLQGEALEKPLRPETWIDAQLGRAAKLANDSQIQRAPGQIMRNLPRHVGTSGILAAKFQSVSQSSTDGKVAVKLEIPGTSEGIVTVSANMGSGVSARDFLSFQAGDPVLAAVRINTADSSRGSVGNSKSLAGMMQTYVSRMPGRSYPGPGFGPGGPMGSSMPGPSVGGTDPLTAWWGISADCTRLNKENDPSSLVAPGIQRQANNVPTAMPTPTQAAVNLDGTVGIDVVWTGKLRELRQLAGEAHFLIDGSDDTPGSFEAFARAPDFIDQVIDYVSSDEKSDGADHVTVTGKLVAKNSTKERLRSSTGPLVLLTEIKRVDLPQSAATPGQQRSAESFDAGRSLSDVRALWRKAPQITPSKAKDNIGTEVVWAGKLKDICQLDGETHFTVYGEGATSGSFEAYTTAADFLAQVTDYVTDQENSDAEDAVIVSGKIVAAEDVTTRLSRSKYEPILLLTEIRRADHSKSAARPDRPRDAGSFDPRRRLPELHALFRNPPEIGTEVRFRAYFRDFHHSSNSKYVTASAIADSYKTVKVMFPNAGKEAYNKFNRDDPVIITAVVTKCDPRNRSSEMEFEGKTMVRAPGTK